HEGGAAAPARNGAPQPAADPVPARGAGVCLPRARRAARARLTVGAIPASPTHRALVLSDGAAGNENQALTLASLLAPAVEALRLESRAPWRGSAPRRLPGAARAFGPAFAARLRAPWPELVVGCGRQAALATRL